MLSLTKIFHFEMAHAIHGYSDSCKNIHGHSYKLHVTVTAGKESKNYIQDPGYILDFKELKRLVTAAIITTLDHQLALSRGFLSQNPDITLQENLVILDSEPTAGNLLIFMAKILTKELPEDVTLVKLKLFETNDSYAEWINDSLKRN